MKRNRFYQHFIARAFLFFLASVGFCASALPAFAAYDQFEPGTAVTLGEFVYDDSFEATTTANCSVTVHDPNGTLVVNAQAMTADADSWYHYTLAPATTEGTWPAFIACGSLGTGDLIKEDKTFVVTSNIVSSSSVAALVNANTNAVVGAASSSLGVSLSSAIASIASVPANVWAYSSRTLTSMGTLVADVWSAAARTLTGAGLDSGSLATQSDVQTASTSVAAVVNANTNNVVGAASSSLGSAVSNASNASGGWSVQMSDFSSALAGGTYRARVVVLNQSTLTAPLSAPAITVYDADRNVVASGVSMTSLSAGVYEYTYSISSSAAEGVWESVVSTQVESGKTIQTNDYWNVVTAPAQVLIQSMGTTQTPSISANMRITNEGSTNYEYQYEWCVVSNINNACGGGDDTYYASAAKLINAGANFDTTLSATVPLAGTYYFKTVVYFGTESSGASRQFVATAAGGGDSGSGDSGGGSGGGGGGGGGSSKSASAKATTALSADLNGDGRVSGVDFSILLAFWKTSPPFKNPAVDINRDGKVDSTDFSILLYRWDK
jgi:hypothetical protein